MEEDAERDERAAQPPADGDRDPGKGEPDPGGSPGPMGNPASDEEALSHRQQEGG